MLSSLRYRDFPFSQKECNNSSPLQCSAVIYDYLMNWFDCSLTRMYLCGERSTRHQLLVERNVYDVIYSFQRNKANHKLCWALWVHLRWNVPPSCRYGNFEVAFSSLAGIDSKINGLSNCSPWNGGYENFGGIVGLAWISKGEHKWLHRGAYIIMT